MSGSRNAGLAAGAIAGLTTGALGLGYVVAKAVARADRRRFHVAGDLTELARAALADAPGMRSSTIPTVDGGRMFVREYGSPEAVPIVLLHGVTLDGSIWHNQCRDLADEYRVIAPDLRGHGRSTPGRNGYGLDLLAADLDGLLGNFKLKNTILVGHSMGGMAMMHFCAKFPATLANRVAGLVFQSTAASDVASGPATAPLKLGRMLAERSPATAGRLTKAPADVGYLGSRFGFGKNPSPVWVEQVRLLLDAMAPVPLAKSVLSLLDHDERATLRTVATRSLVLVGTKDLVTPEVQSREIAELLPNSELVTFADAGHTLMLERSSELSVALRQFANARG